MTLRIHLFGPLRARDGEQALKLPPRSKLVSLWAYLLVHRGRATPRTLLAYSFWPDDSEAEARLQLRRHLHRLLRLLPAPQAGRPWILSDHSTLQWNPQADAWLDLAEFERLCRQPDGAAEAVALYAGDLLEGLYDDWLLAERERLRDLCFVALHAVVEQMQAAGDGQQAILYAQRLLRLDPLREETYRTLMRLHARSGDRAGVVRHYNACVTVLQRELGVEPSAETGRVYRDGLAGPPAVEAPDTPPGSAALRHNLPAHLTSFVGRERELEQVRSLLAAARLLTLTGIGGVGKTRLALAAAHSAREHLADGVWWVDLSPLVDPGLLEQAVASAIGLREQSTRPLAQALAESLRAKQLLLVLDNCEHLIEACAALAGRLLAGAGRLQILTTSTEPLGVPGEVVWPVPPLAVPGPATAAPQEDLEGVASVRLFVERATAALPTFRLTPANGRAVALLCRALDGIPLALELAAARLKLLTVEQLVERLDDRFRLLAGGRRTGLPRHRTMQAVLDWSHALLAEPERALLRRLSLFVGGFTLESAEAICAGDPLAADDLLGVLSELVDKSFVTVSRADPARARYGLLETVGHYARAKLLESGEAEQIRQRHDLYFLGLAEEAAGHLLRGPDQGRWLGVIAREHDNLRSVMSRADSAGDLATLARIGGRLWPFWWTRGLVAEGRLTLEGLLPRRAALEPALQALALHAAGRLMLLQGDYAPAARALEESLEGYRRLGDQAGAADALSGLGVVAGYQQDYARAEDLWSQSLQAYEALGDRWGVARALNNLGDLAVYLGDHATAVVRLTQSVSIFRELNSTLGESIGLINLGRAHFLLGQAGEAAAHFRQSLRLKIELADREGIAWNLEGLAGVAAAQGQAARAARLFGAADRLRQAIGIPLAAPDRPFHERNLARAQAQLEARAWEALWAEGAAAAPDEAIAYALADADDPAPGRSS